MLQLLDLAGIYFRAFHAVPGSVTAPDGRPANAIRGALDIIARVAADARPTRLVACLDLDWRPAFRVALLPSYKAHRVASGPAGNGPAGNGDLEAVPDELGPQVPVLLEVLRAIGVTTAGADGYEADDVIATLADTERGDPVEVVTGDRDLFQLAAAGSDGRPEIRIRYIGAGMSRTTVLTASDVAAKHGIPAGHYADFAALRGDPSDGLPGVPGIGDKTAATLVTAFGSIERLLAAAADPGSAMSSGPRSKLLVARDYLAVAPGVVRVVRDAPVKLTPAGHAAVPVAPVDPAALIAAIKTWGIGGPVKRLTDALGVDAAAR